MPVDNSAVLRLNEEKDREAIPDCARRNADEGNERLCSVDYVGEEQKPAAVQRSSAHVDPVFSRMFPSYRPHASVVRAATPS